MSVQHTDWQCGATCPDGRPCTVPLVDWGGSHVSLGPCDSTPVDPTTCPCEDCRLSLMERRELRERSHAWLAPTPPAAPAA